LGALGPERRHHDVPPRLQRSANGLDVAFAGLGLAQEMKNGAVVPEVVSRGLERSVRDVRAEPAHAGGAFAEPGAGRIEGRLGEIEDREVLVSPVQETVGEGRSAAAHVDDGRAAPDPGGLQERNGPLEVRPEPADLAGTLARVDVFPVFLAGHVQGATATASISTRKSGLASRTTWRKVLAGGAFVK